MNEILKSMKRNLLQKNTWQYWSMLAIALVVIAFFYRDIFFSGFDLLLGDDIDAHLNIVIADSWNDYFQGCLPLRQTRIFYPVDHARGFTDLNLSLYILQKPLLWMGMNNVHSAQIIYGLLLLTGIMSMFHLCRLFNLSWLTSVFCSLLAFFNNAFWCKQLHTQFFFICLIPLLGICVLRYLQYFNEQERVKSMLYGCAGCLFFALIAYSNFYSAYFFVMWMVVFLPVLILILKKRGILCLNINKQKILELAGIVCLGIILHIPFIYIYYPVMSTYKRSWFEVAGGLPVLSDVLNFGKDNWLWGDLYQRFFPSLHKNFYEQIYGLTPFTFLCLSVLVIYVMVMLCRKKDSVPVWVLSFLITLLVVNVLIIKVLPNTSPLYPYTSLWYGAYQILPGASAIRSMTRIYVFFMFVWVILLGWLIDKVASLIKQKYSAAFTFLIGCILLLDNFNISKAANWRYSESKAFIDNVPTPPADCKVFLMIPSDLADPSCHARIGLLAWSIARKHNLYTINGYSGNFPVEIAPYRNQKQDDFVNNINIWMQKHNLRDVYVYDYKQKTWNKWNF